MPPQTHEWYIFQDGQQYGPYSDHELEQRIEDGRLQPTELIWRPGLPDWRPAKQRFPQNPKFSGQPHAIAERGDVRVREDKAATEARSSSLARWPLFDGKAGAWGRRIFIGLIVLLCAVAIGVVSGHFYGRYARPAAFVQPK
jgi:hypothetical protein